MFTYLAPIFVYLIDPSITDQGGIDTPPSPICELVRYPAKHSGGTLNNKWGWENGPVRLDPYSLTRFAKKQLACQLVRVTFATWTHLPAICHEHDYTKRWASCLYPFSQRSRRLHSTGSRPEAFSDVYASQVPPKSEDKAGLKPNCLKWAWVKTEHPHHLCLLEMSRV